MVPELETLQPLTFLLGAGFGSASFLPASAAGDPLPTSGVEFKVRENPSSPVSYILGSWVVNNIGII